MKLNERFRWAWYGWTGYASTLYVNAKAEAAHAMYEASQSMQRKRDLELSMAAIAELRGLMPQWEEFQTWRREQSNKLTEKIIPKLIEEAQRTDG